MLLWRRISLGDALGYPLGAMLQALWLSAEYTTSLGSSRRQRRTVHHLVGVPH